MPDYSNPSLILVSDKIYSDKVAWQCPSNIALIKYWGKYGQQLPRNPSISFTLNNANTKTSIEYRSKEDDQISFDIIFEGKTREDFKPKIHKFLSQITNIYPFIKQLHFTIRSENSFPHSTGIASSASSMGAIALCLCSIEENLFGKLASLNSFYTKASFLARIGSGSACRSIFPVASMWGKSTDIVSADDNFGIPFGDNIHPIFHSFHDDILIVSAEEKAVSSTVGHELMNNNIYAESRYSQAKTNLHSLINTLKSGDLNTFIKIVEKEALSLHALMMTSDPSFILILPETLTLIEKIRIFRKEKNVPVCFTLDAGPNIHLLYPDEFAGEVGDFINSALSKHFKNILKDKIGPGPTKIL